MAKKCSKLKLGDLVEVVWWDAVGENDGWFDPILFDYEDHEKVTEVRSVGYYQNKTKANIFLSQLKRTIDGGCARLFSIPICAIKEVVGK